MKLKKNSF